MALKLEAYQNYSLKVLLEHRLLSSTPRVSDAVGLKRDLHFSFITSCYVRLVLPIRGSYIENHHTIILVRKDEVSSSRSSVLESQAGLEASSVLP